MRKRRRPRPKPDRALSLVPVTRDCPECQHPLRARYNNFRAITTRDGVLRLTLAIRRCPDPDCPRFRLPYRPEAEPHSAWPDHEFGLAAPHQGRRRAGRRHQALRRAVFAVTTPVLALPLAVGITDPPVLALFCVALACLGAGPAARGAASRATGLRGLVSPHRIRPSRPAGAALAIGIACAMKITAWPALPVIAVMIAARDGRRAAWRFVAASAVTAGTAIAAAAPAALAKPTVFLHNTVLYPLGLTRHLTPAASPLPGHLLAATGTAGRWAAICLLD